MERDDMLDASMLEVTGEEPVALLTLVEEAVLQREEQSPRKIKQLPCILPSDWRRLLSLKMPSVQGWWQLSPRIHECRSHCLHWDLPDYWLSDQSHPPEDADMPRGIPKGARLDLASLSSMQMIILRNNMTRDLEYHYNARVISSKSLCLAPPYIQGWPGTNQELEDQVTTHSGKLTKTHIEPIKT